MSDPIKVVVTSRGGEGSITNDSTAVTPGTETPNLIVQALSPLRIVATRVARNYLTVVVGLVTAGITGADAGMMPDAFGALVWKAAQLGLSSAGVSLLVNALELITRLDESFPKLRA